MYATPQAHDAQGGSAERVRRFGSKHGGRNLSDETVAGISPSSPQVTPASHSQSPGSDWARKMTATYGRKFADYWLNSDPPDSWVRTLLGTSVWASTMCYLTWKRSTTPQGRLLFRLVPSTPRTAGIGSGFWGTPTSRDHKDGSSVANVPENGLLGRQVVNRERMLPTPTVDDSSNVTRKGGSESDKPFSSLTRETAIPNMKLNSAWVAVLMGFPPNWLDLGD